MTAPQETSQPMGAAGSKIVPASSEDLFHNESSDDAGAIFETPAPAGWERP